MGRRRLLNWSPWRRKVGGLTRSGVEWLTSGVRPLPPAGASLRGRLDFKPYQSRGQPGGERLGFVGAGEMNLSGTTEDGLLYDRREHCLPLDTEFNDAADICR